MHPASPSEFDTLIVHSCDVLFVFYEHPLVLPRHPFYLFEFVFVPIFFFLFSFFLLSF